MTCLQDSTYYLLDKMFTLESLLKGWKTDEETVVSVAGFGDITFQSKDHVSHDLEQTKIALFQITRLRLEQGEVDEYRD